MRIFEVDVAPGGFHHLPSAMDELIAREKEWDNQVFRLTNLIKRHKLFTDRPSDDPELAELETKLAAAKAELSSVQDQIDSSDDEAYLQIIRDVETECKEAVNAYKTTWRVLYRGVRKSDVEHAAFIGNSRHDRVPSESDPGAQERFDYALTQLGIRALRSNSIFTTSNLSHSRDYGVPYIIFPIDGKSSYSYTRFQDLILKTPDIEIMGNKSKLQELQKQMLEIGNTSDSERIKREAAWYSKIEPGHLFGLLPEMYNDSEIVDSFPNISFDWHNYVDVERFRKYYEPHDDNLAQALRNETEVCVSGYYYALHLKAFRSLIAEMWNLHLP